MVCRSLHSNVHTRTHTHTHARAHTHTLLPLSPFTSIGDFWITQSRLEMGVQFLYPFDTDNMYVITSSKEEAPSLWTILSKPWQPFTFELWLYNLAFILLVSATVTTITDYGNEHDFVNDRWVARWLKGAYMNSIAFVSRSIKNNPRSVPARLAAFGYGFFLLVISNPPVLAPVPLHLATNPLFELTFGYPLRLLSSLTQRPWRPSWLPKTPTTASVIWRTRLISRPAYASCPQSPHNSGRCIHGEYMWRWWTTPQFFVVSIPASVMWQ